MAWIGTAEWGNYMDNKSNFLESIFDLTAILVFLGPLLTKFISGFIVEMAVGLIFIQYFHFSTTTHS